MTAEGAEVAEEPSASTASSAVKAFQEKNQPVQSDGHTLNSLAMTETQQRFLKEIADRVSSGRVEELRLYPTLRVGPIESGVAIVALGELVDVSAPAPAIDGQAQESEAESAVVVVEAVDAPASSQPANELARLSIHTAHFRHTVKGPDRGKWEFFMVHDADAPIETVESVVRGVARRAGEDGEPELLSANDFQRALTEPWWTATA